jgi:hypothetical protein
VFFSDSAGGIASPAGKWLRDLGNQHRVGWAMSKAEGAHLSGSWSTFSQVPGTGTGVGAS